MEAAAVLRPHSPPNGCCNDPARLRPSHIRHVYSSGAGTRIRPLPLRTSLLLVSSVTPPEMSLGTSCKSKGEDTGKDRKDTGDTGVRLP